MKISNINNKQAFSSLSELAIRKSPTTDNIKSQVTTNTYRLLNWREVVFLKTKNNRKK